MCVVCDVAVPGFLPRCITLLSHNKISLFQNYYISVPAPAPSPRSLFPSQHHVRITAPSRLQPSPSPPSPPRDPREHTLPKVWSTNSPAYPTTAPSSSSLLSYIAYTGESTPTPDAHISIQPPCPFSHPAQMSEVYPTLFTMARNKLHAAIGGRDNCNLHRWVLLKNSIFRSQSPLTPPVLSGPSSSVCVCSEDVVECEGDGGDLEESEFLFPDASKLVSQGGADMSVSEAEWLDSLLETLCEGEEDEFCADANVRVSVVAVEEEDGSLSPLTSPMSSSDDLLSQHAQSPPSPAVSYPVPYPPFHPPLLRPCELGPIIESPLISPPTAYEALSRYDMDELDDLSVPEAIEDTSDDESSDIPSTPLLGRSSDLLFASSLSGERRRPPSRPDVYIHTTGSVFDRFELDPLPFPDEDNLNSYNVYQEC